MPLLSAPSFLRRVPHRGGVGVSSVSQAQSLLERQAGTPAPPSGLSLLDRANASPPPGATPLVQPSPDVPTAPRVWPRASLLLLGALAFGVVAVGAVSEVFVPHPSWWLATGSASTSVLLLVSATRLLSQAATSPRAPVSAVGACVALLSLFAWGAQATPVIDGEAAFVGSSSAQVHAYAAEARDDLLWMMQHDHLLELDEATARAQQQQFEAAHTELVELSRSYAAQEPGSLPDPALADAASEIAAAALYGAEAFDRRQALFTQRDARLRAEMASAREAFAEHALRAAPLLEEVAEAHGAPIDPASDMVVE